MGGILSSVFTQASVSIISKRSFQGPSTQAALSRNLKTDIDVRTNTMVVDISSDKVVTAVGPNEGL